MVMAPFVEMMLFFANQTTGNSSIQGRNSTGRLT